MRETKRPRASRNVWKRHRTNDVVFQSRKTGAKTITLATSPSHQVHQIDNASFDRAGSAHTRLQTPIVAAIVALTTPARNANLKMSDDLFMALRPPAKRKTR